MLTLSLAQDVLPGLDKRTFSHELNLSQASSTRRQRNLGHENHTITMTQSVSKSTFLKLFSVHTKTRKLRLFKVYMTDFFICSIKSLQCTDKYSQNTISIAIYFPRVLMHQKRQISLPVGYKTAIPKTGDWERP